jgi:hypothetical protein
MKWTVSWFLYQEKRWEERSEDADSRGLEGHKCYAEKQILAWRMIKDHFENDWVGTV